MRSIKLFSLAALAALMAMAFVGASSAMAEPTGLCSSDSGAEAEEGECGPITHVHETSVGKAKLLSSSLNVECNVLFLGTVTEEGSPLEIEGNFTYSSCGSCTVTEVNGPVTIGVLWTGHETGAVEGEGEVHVECFGFINCVYNGEGLLGTAKGALLSTQTNGEVSISEQTTTKVSGSLCPSTAKLDITTTPLSPNYIRIMVCVPGTLYLTNDENHKCLNHIGGGNGYYQLKWRRIRP